MDIQFNATCGAIESVHLDIHIIVNLEITVRIYIDRVQFRIDKCVILPRSIIFDIGTDESQGVIFHEIVITFQEHECNINIIHSIV